MNEIAHAPNWIESALNGLAHALKELAHAPNRIAQWLKTTDKPMRPAK